MESNEKFIIGEIYFTTDPDNYIFEAIDAEKGSYNDHICGNRSFRKGTI